MKGGPRGRDGVAGPALLFLVLVLPLVRVFWGGLFTPDSMLELYERVWRTPVYGRVFWITLEISLLTTTFSVLLGHPSAYFLASVKPRTRQILLLCVIMPFFPSMLVRNYVSMILLQGTGLVNRMLVESGVVSTPLDLRYNELGVLSAMCRS
jgi:putative spermidine/putrescine transport system permease protein